VFLNLTGIAEPLPKIISQTIIKKNLNKLEQTEGFFPYGTTAHTWALYSSFIEVS
jgi:hypothetical protein